MREITTIIQNSNSDTSEKLTNGFVPQTTKQYSSLTGTIATTENDRNNNNVMKKSMPPPIPPKKYNRNNRIAAKINIDSVDDSKVNGVVLPSNGSNDGTSKNTVINHVHGPSTLIATSNELHKLSNPSKVNDKNDEKGQSAVSNTIDSVAVITTTGVASGLANINSSDNNKNLNDDIRSSTTKSKCSPSSGTSHQCDNGMTMTCLNSPLFSCTFTWPVFFSATSLCFSRSNFNHLLNLLTTIQ